MRNRHQLNEIHRAEQLKHIAQDGAINHRDIINHSQGRPPPLLERAGAILPLLSGVLEFIRRRFRQTKYLITNSAVIVDRNSKGVYIPMHHLRRARASNKGNGMVYLLTAMGNEPAIGPMERAEMFADAVNRTINSAVPAKTCQDCALYHRDPDPVRGNAGHCRYQQLVLGNYDVCRKIECRTETHGAARNNEM